MCITLCLIAGKKLFEEIVGYFSECLTFVNPAEKSYVYKRNLKRHIKERHLPIEHWNCTETNCLSQFIRRSYLSTHLILKHGYDKKSAIETAITAHRGDISQQSGFYEDISDDDTILDLLQERSNSMKEQGFSEMVILILVCSVKIPLFQVSMTLMMFLSVTLTLK